MTAAMAWLSRLVLKLDADGKAAIRQAAFEENVRLALWRMDSALTGLISLENARPYDSYPTLIRKPPENESADSATPLSTASPLQILLYFQFEPDGRLVSPGSTKEQSAQLDQLRRKVTKSELLKSIQYTNHIQTVHKRALPEARDENQSAAYIDKLEPGQASPLKIRDSTDSGPAVNSAPAANPAPFQSRADKAVQQSMNIAEQNIRQSVVTMNDVRFQSLQSQTKSVSVPPESKSGQRVQSVTEWVTQSQDTNLELMHPVWLDKDLFLVRRVSIDKKEYVQGCWLDWPGIRSMLLKLVEDLLPDANLKPLLQLPETEQTRLLASIPAQLTPGSLPAEKVEGWSILHYSLGIAWLGVLLATVAVGIVLRKTAELNKRRGAFVSAVTHELRTPLTTFRMYTEMLDEDMVPEEETRKQYVGVLHNEAERLSHLVENVLAYAQLENNRGGAERIETVPLEEVKERIVPRLTERAAQCGMELKLEMGETADSISVRADLSAVERILFNLVDNAGKYARNSQNLDILFSIGITSGMAVLSIRDHGPGVPSHLRRKLFVPFAKSASDAANSAPGVGIGLTISRRLARQMNGDLYLDNAVTHGAAFVLTLPLA